MSTCTASSRSKWRSSSLSMLTMMTARSNAIN
jgi:hypothetical protein